MDLANGELGEERTNHLDDAGKEIMTVYCPKRDASFEVQVDMPTGARIDEIQKQLGDLLIADAE
jgi:hypothetical protein